MRYALLLSVLLFGAGAVAGVVFLMPSCAGQSDPFLDEVGEINARYAREADALYAAEEWEWQEADWKHRYAAEVRDAYQRHGRTVPAWAAQGSVPVSK